MDIKKLNTYMRPPLHESQEAVFRSKAEENGSGVRTGAASRDRVELSVQYREVNEMTKVSEDREEIRTELVDRFRNLLKNDQYTIDAEKIAEKMLSEIL